MTSEEPRHGIRRILVAIDASEHSQAALRAAVELARQTHGEVQGIFVEDENLLRMADISFTREIRLFSTGVSACSTEDIRRQLRVQAQRAEELLSHVSERAGVPASFRVVRGQVTRELLAAAEEIDLISLGRAGHAKGDQPVLGSTAEAVLQQAARPVMVLREGVRLHPPVLVLSDGSPATTDALMLAGEITQSARYMPVSVLTLSSNSEEIQKLEQEALGVMKAFDVPVSFHALQKPFAHQLVHAIETEGCGVVLAPASLLETYPNALRRIIASIDCPIILMR